MTERAGESGLRETGTARDTDVQTAMLLTQSEWDAADLMARAYLASTRWYEADKAGLYEDVERARALARRIIEANQ